MRKLAPVTGTTTDYDFIIVGGGAAGFFSAVNAARFSGKKKIAILEKSNKVLAKVLVSGGGRCNVTHQCTDNKELVKFYPRGGKELRSAFSRFSVEQTIAWFESRGVKLKTEMDGRMFPVTDNSETIANCLFAEAKQYGVEIRFKSEVTSIEKTEAGFLLTINETEKINCRKLLIASGGSPKSSGYDFIVQSGHTIIDPVPSLFTFNMPGNPIKELMGLSVENASVKIEGTGISTEGPLLITHWGMSGPAILKASAWGARELAARSYHFTALINWLPGRKEEAAFEELQVARNFYKAQQLQSVNPFFIPRRLWAYFIQKNKMNMEIRWADLSNKQLRSLAITLTADKYAVDGKTTFKEEFVTCGGVALGEVDFKNMESRKVPGLYFAGEVLDIDGVTGGFNFQSAWTTGWLSACGMAELDAKNAELQ